MHRVVDGCAIVYMYSTLIDLESLLDTRLASHDTNRPLALRWRSFSGTSQEHVDLQGESQLGRVTWSYQFG